MRSEPTFSSNWRQKAADGGDRTFRDQFTKREPTSAFGSRNNDSTSTFGSRTNDRESAFGSRTERAPPVWGRKEGSNPFSKDGSAFTRKERDPLPPVEKSTKPKVNPFGNAVAKDVHAIQKEILEKKEPKAIEMESVKKEITQIKHNQDKKLDSVPTGAGAWRSRNVDGKKKESVFSKPAGFETKPKDLSKVELKTKAQMETAKGKAATKKSENSYDLLDNVF